MEYYGETLQMASDEIDKITDQMEHHNSVLEHYLSILELMGESANYKTIGVVLEGQAEVKKDRMIAAQKEW
jgi:6-phosphofructokinase